MSKVEERDPWDSVYNPDQDRHDLECARSRVQELEEGLQKVRRWWAISLTARGMQLDSAEKLVDDFFAELPVLSNGERD